MIVVDIGLVSLLRDSERKKSAVVKGEIIKFWGVLEDTSSSILWLIKIKSSKPLFVSRSIPPEVWTLKSVRLVVRLNPPCPSEDVFISPTFEKFDCYWCHK